MSRPQEAMKNNTRRIALLTVLAAALGLFALLERPSEDPVPNVAPRQVPAAVQITPAVVEPVPVNPVSIKPVPVIPVPVNRPAIARVPVPVPVRDDPKLVPAVENSQAVTKGLISPPELVPVAAVGSDAGKSAGTGAPDVKPADQRPNSLFGWGPWAGGQPGATTGATTGAPSPPQDGIPSVQGINSTVSAAGSTPVTPPPVVVPPPATDSSIRPGLGLGDRNHVHIHRRDR